MKGYVKIERYSIDGFKPQKQIHYMNIFRRQMNVDVKKLVNQFSDLTEKQYKDLTTLFEKNKKWFTNYYEKYQNMLQYGILVFSYDQKLEKLIEYFGYNAPKHIGYLPEENVVLPVEFLPLISWNPTPIGKYLNKFNQCFVPEQSLKGLIIES